VIPEQVPAVILYFPGINELVVSALPVVVAVHVSDPLNVDPGGFLTIVSDNDAVVAG
jgi:hypothetical protein